MGRTKKVITQKELESFEKLNSLSELGIDQQQIYVAFLTLVHKIEDRVFSNLIAEDEESEDENHHEASNEVEQTELLLLQQVEQSFMRGNTQQGVDLLGKVIENEGPWSDQAVQNIQNLGTEFLFENKLDYAQKCFQILINTCSGKKQFVRNYLGSIVNTGLVALRKGNYANAIENTEFVINYTANKNIHKEDINIDDINDIVEIAYKNYDVIINEMQKIASQNLS